MADIIITNNLCVRGKYSIDYSVDYMDAPPLEILIRARDYIHKGHKLLTHPMSGSIKHGYAPFKSILITCETGPFDYESLKLIEDSIAIYKTFPLHLTNGPGHITEDFKEIDCSLINEALRKHIH